MREYGEGKKNSRKIGKIYESTIYFEGCLKSVLNEKLPSINLNKRKFGAKNNNFPVCGVKEKSNGRSLFCSKLTDLVVNFFWLRENQEKISKGEMKASGMHLGCLCGRNCKESFAVLW